jgi:hypothetical protein
LSKTVEVGARHEFRSGEYPEDTFGFQAITTSSGDVVLALSLTEGSSVFAETSITLPQLDEFARSLAAAIRQARELDEAKRYGWLNDYMRSGIFEFKSSEDGS